MRFYSWIVIGALALGAAGCGKNERATKKCRASTECAACCSANGASGHASGTVNGKYSCKCLGKK